MRMRKSEFHSRTRFRVTIDDSEQCPAFGNQAQRLPNPAGVYISGKFEGFDKSSYIGSHFLSRL